MPTTASATPSHWGHTSAQPTWAGIMASKSSPPSNSPPRCWLLANAHPGRDERRFQGDELADRENRRVHSQGMTTTAATAGASDAS